MNPVFSNNSSNAEDKVMALRLITLYNWAKGTELLAKYMLQGEPAGIGALLDKHFDAGVGAAAASGDAQIEVLLRWLHAASRQMVAGSIWWRSGCELPCGKVCSRSDETAGHVRVTSASAYCLAGAGTSRPGRYRGSS